MGSALINIVFPVLKQNLTIKGPLLNASQLSFKISDLVRDF